MKLFDICYEKNMPHLVQKFGGKVNFDGEPCTVYKNASVPYISIHTRDFNRRLCFATWSAREHLLLNPESKTLTRKFDELLLRIPKEGSIFEILKCVQTYTRSIFVHKEEKKVHELLTRISFDRIKNRFVEIDFFIRERTGICRHLALVNAYFLYRLITQGILKGKTILYPQIFTDNIGHAWNLFCDTSNGNVYSLDSSHYLDPICVSTNSKLIDSIYERTLLESKKLPQGGKINPIEDTIRFHLEEIFIPEVEEIIDPKVAALEELLSFRMKLLTEKHIQLITQFEKDIPETHLLVWVISKFTPQELEQKDPKTCIMDRMSFLKRLMEDPLTSDTEREIQDLSLDEDQIEVSKSKFQQMNEAFCIARKFFNFSASYLYEIQPSLFKLNSVYDEVLSFFANHYPHYNWKFLNIENIKTAEELCAIVHSLSRSSMNTEYIFSRFPFIVGILKTDKFSIPRDNTQILEFADSCLEIKKYEEMIMDMNLKMDDVYETDPSNAKKAAQAFPFLNSNSLKHVAHRFSLYDILENTDQVIEKRKKLLLIDAYIEKAIIQADLHLSKSSCFTIGMHQKAQEIRTKINELKSDLNDFKSHTVDDQSFEEQIKSLRITLNSPRYRIFCMSKNSDLGDSIAKEVSELKFH